ncbi:sensor histidine kinase [Methylobacterium symbioticum]|uniref:Signal transduction histidine-protein kinase/phosphatase UhpB n=1 Tax=Methylobacterium symbioticum TaxID=2584084 RepID=A0A509EJL8_9HYPH|nr:histidine kinase [Methylobacterium symbioticum]VUD73575.1 Signal transduction histidine-protein kinase/phosphatase UhpB [Methylobacterium symbioticum]
MSLPAHLGLRLLAVALLCCGGAMAWSLWEARASLRTEAEVSAARIAAQYARQPGLGSAGPAAPAATAPQPAPAILTLLPGICAEIRLAAEAARRHCGDWDGLDAAPGWLRSLLARDAGTPPALRDIVYRDRIIGTVAAWPDPAAAASGAWHQMRLAGGLAIALATTTALLGWLAAARLVAPAARIVRGLETLGADAVRRPRPRFAAVEFDRIAAACDGLAERLSRAEAARAGLMQRLVAVQEEEREALARDLHDAFGQCLAAVGARAASIEAAAPEDRADLRADAQGIEAVVATMRESLRGALARLELPDLAEIGLAAALQGLVADWQAHAGANPSLHLDVAGDLAGLPRDAASSLYRVAQELLTNALRHGRPSRVFLRLERAPEGRQVATLTVDDDGGGDAVRALAEPGRGLTGVRARVAALGGSLSLTGTGSGIRACAAIPTAG